MSSASTPGRSTASSPASSDESWPRDGSGFSAICGAGRVAASTPRMASTGPPAAATTTTSATPAARRVRTRRPTNVSRPSTGSSALGRPMRDDRPPARITPGTFTPGTFAPGTLTRRAYRNRPG